MKDDYKKLQENLVKIKEKVPEHYDKTVKTLDGITGICGCCGNWRDKEVSYQLSVIADKAPELYESYLGIMAKLDGHDALEASGKLSSLAGYASKYFNDFCDMLQMCDNNTCSELISGFEKTFSSSLRDGKYNLNPDDFGKLVGLLTRVKTDETIRHEAEKLQSALGTIDDFVKKMVYQISEGEKNGNA